MQKAHIFQINIYQGGVPKLPYPEAEVTFVGIKGGKHNNLEVHGGPLRALCLYSLERIITLQEEGHPIYPGATGENVVLMGINWDKIEPGCRLKLGNTVEIEVTTYTEPCPKIKKAFSEGKISRMAQKNYPGWSRVYAKVLCEGPITIGDKVELITSSSLQKKEG